MNTDVSFFTIAISLFLILNALGSIPLFVGLLTKFPPKKQRRIILRELVIALVILLIFTFFGDEILNMLGISQAVIGIAGGTLLFLIALGMIFPRSTELPKNQQQEPMIVPLAMPLIAGPGTISALIVYAEHTHNSFLVAGALIAAWIPSAILLILASNVKYILGEKGLLACTRLGGMLLTLISVQMFTQGLVTLLTSVH